MSTPLGAQFITPVSFDTFGELLHYLRRRSRLTQQDLASAVGYSVAQICRFERNHWLPDPATVAALFVPALQLQHQPEFAARLIALANTSHPAGFPKRSERTENRISVTRNIPSGAFETLDDLGGIEDIPMLPSHNVIRETTLNELRQQLGLHRCIALVGLAGMGKTALAAALAREREQYSRSFG